MAAADDLTSTFADLGLGPFSGIDKSKITIRSDCGQNFVGFLHETRSLEIVILCNSFPGTKDYGIMVELCSALEKQGISAFCFDCVFERSNPFGSCRKEATDLGAVIQYFTAADRVVSAIIGHSKGANVVILYASLHQDIRTVVSLSGCYNTERDLEVHLGKDFMERVRKDGFIPIKSETGEVWFNVCERGLLERLYTNMHEAGLKIGEYCKVLTVHGSVDEVFPVEDAMEFAKIIPNHELRIIEGANHGYTNHRDELISVVLDFIKDNMHIA